MAAIRVKGDLSGLLRFIRPFSMRAQRLPKSYELVPTGALAHIHHNGAKIVVNDRMRRKLAAITGETPPATGKVLVIPARPVRVDKQLERGMAKGVAVHIIKGKPVEAERLMKSGALRHFDTRQGWVRARDWGRDKRSSPNPLGGSGGQVAAGWKDGRLREKR